MFPPSSPKIGSSVKMWNIPGTIAYGLLTPLGHDTNLIGNKDLILLDKVFDFLKNPHEPTLIAETILFHLDKEYFGHVGHLAVPLCHH